MSSCTPRDASEPVFRLKVLPTSSGGAHAAFGSRRTGWKRALVLAGVWLFMGAHFVQWIAMGTTLAPIEPSESMQTVKGGVITVGAIFFAVALLSTAIFGRWFCGWGCHWVAIQDATAWALARAGLRPKPFRSRLLVWVPLLLALYMFVWPLFYRFAVAPWVQPDLRWPGWSAHFFTDDYWLTFPGLAMAVPFTLVTGVFIIYLLGAKGYCTYACPYGGLFAPFDEVAPMRIVVDHDKCHQCGHCTAVCTSNVRVHEEIRDYGMVVDRGCMKCMDCVTVCPNQALSFGLGKPSLLIDRTGSRAAASAERRYDLTWGEEIALAVLAAATFLSVRGIYLGVPLLFASGIAICVVFMAWKSWRVLRDANASFHSWRLRFHGALRPAGVAWLACTAALLAGVAYFGALNALIWQADRLDAQVTLPAEAVFSEAAQALSAPMAESARGAIEMYTRASLAPEGISLIASAQQVIDLRRAYLAAALRDMPRAERILRGAWARDGDTQPVAAGIGRVLRATPSRREDAIAWYDQVLAQHPDWQTLREEQITWLDGEGEYARAIQSARQGMAAMPQSLLAMRRLSLTLVERATTPLELEEGIEIIRRTIQIDPNNAFAYAALGRGLVKQEKLDDAIAAFDRAVELSPDSDLLQKMREEARGMK